MTKKPCPWPDKVKHPTPEAAWGHVLDLRRAGKGTPDDSVYPCGDHFHVGHDLRSFKRRIRNATRAGNRAGQARSRRNRRR